MEDMKWIIRVVLVILIGGLLTFLFYTYEDFAQPFRAFSLVLIIPVTIVTKLCHYAGFDIPVYEMSWPIWTINILTGIALTWLWELFMAWRQRKANS
ncbi:MAG: hypothetical protein JNK10_14285 [Cyclobacteriaceae bacterium]|nr:hypothetical protein [Cyclobacteriaceae bacterium]